MLREHCMPKPLTKIVIAAFCLCCCLLIQSGPAKASDFRPAAGKGAFGLSLNYQGAGIKYFISDSFALEVKGQAEGGR